MSALTTTGTGAIARPTARTLRHSLVLAKRNLIKTSRTPEQLIDVTLQPVIFLLLFIYVFGGAISGGSRHEYLQYLLPGMLGQGIECGRRDGVRRVYRQPGQQAAQPCARDVDGVAVDVDLKGA